MTKNEMRNMYQAGQLAGIILTEAPDAHKTGKQRMLDHDILELVSFCQERGIECEIKWGKPVYHRLKRMVYAPLKSIRLGKRTYNVSA